MYRIPMFDINLEISNNTTTMLSLISFIQSIFKGVEFDPIVALWISYDMGLL